MNKYWSGLVVAGAMASMVTLGAQGAGSPANTPPPAAPTGAQQPSQSADQKTASTITVSGCVQNAPAASASAGRDTSSDTAKPGQGARTSDSSFVLASAMPAAGSQAGRAVGTSGATATSYKLEGSTSELSKHVNHQVEITGRLQSSSSSSTGAAGGASATGPTLMVESVRMLSSTCTTTGAKPGQQQSPGETPKPQQ